MITIRISIQDSRLERETKLRLCRLTLNNCLSKKNDRLLNIVYVTTAIFIHIIENRRNSSSESIDRGFPYCGGTLIKGEADRWCARVKELWRTVRQTDPRFSSHKISHSRFAVHNLNFQSLHLSSPTCRASEFYFFI